MEHEGGDRAAPWGTVGQEVAPDPHATMEVACDRKLDTQIPRGETKAPRSPRQMLILGLEISATSGTNEWKLVSV